ncbi:putative Knirps-related protein [Danaus plexippus plexippus]|uniref:Knirps-related protein n=1 Tax=Danaus plexippus plexippus TaxID=278856 RepID=A0A212FLX2_DANPL|nr:putative Knirps-related protein [Danaus plexippus plexippus]
MNQKCKVCGEPAAGFHFGAFTCEGCKSLKRHREVEFRGESVCGARPTIKIMQHYYTMYQKIKRLDNILFTAYKINKVY